MIKEKQYIFLLLLFFGLANIFFWLKSHKIQKEWLNVPPVPMQQQASLIALGDKQLAYRSYTLMLQNMGSVDGKQIALKDYNYPQLKNWFFLTDALDPLSNAVPMIAAYYYGVVNEAEKLEPVLDYLSVIGARPQGEKWRWLAHAVYLAQHVLKDNQKALELSYLLAANKDPKMADWARQMPAFVLQQSGQSELAYKIMLNILISNIDTMHPNEINLMKDYMCHTLIPEIPDITPPEFCQEPLP